MMEGAANTPERRLDYGRLVESITQLHERAQAGAAAAVNRYLVLRNWLTGAYIVEFEQRGTDRARYGQRLLERLSADLIRRGIRGLSTTNLRQSRQLYRLYPQIHQTLSDESPQAIRAVGDLAVTSDLDLPRISATLSRKSNERRARNRRPTSPISFAIPTFSNSPAWPSARNTLRATWRERYSTTSSNSSWNSAPASVSKPARSASPSAPSTTTSTSCSTSAACAATSSWT